MQRKLLSMGLCGMAGLWPAEAEAGRTQDEVRCSWGGVRVGGDYVRVLLSTVA